ncbi:MAG: hypothetical protein ACQEP7_07335, partial [bacterium]
IENLSEIFKAALINQSVEVKKLKTYLHEVEPGLKDISRALQRLAEENREEISSETARAIEEGLQLMSLADGRMQERDNREIYDQMAEFMDSELPHKKSFDEILLYMLLILGGSLLTAAIIPHMIDEHEKYMERAQKLMSWLADLLNKTPKE